jgi:hypothetical protein
MAKTLFIFLFSSQVDLYINAIAYTYDKMKIYILPRFICYSFLVQIT